MTHLDLLIKSPEKEVQKAFNQWIQEAIKISQGGDYKAKATETMLQDMARQPDGNVYAWFQGWSFRQQLKRGLFRSHV